MQVLEAISNAFINTFGITQPTDRTRRQAAWFIFALLVLTLAVVAGAGLLIRHLMRP